MMKKMYAKLKTLHRAFVVAILANAAIGCADIAVSVLFLTGKMSFISSIAPNFAHEIQATGTFYFLSHGIIKLLLSWNLLRERLWAYPVAIVFFSIFSVTQLVELFVSFSWFVFILFVVNFGVLIMVSLEYRRVREILRNKNTQRTL